MEAGGIIEGFMEQVVYEMDLKGWVVIWPWRKTFTSRGQYEQRNEGRQAENLFRKSLSI